MHVAMRELVHQDDASKDVWTIIGCDIGRDDTFHRPVNHRLISQNLSDGYVLLCILSS